MARPGWLCHFKRRVWCDIASLAGVLLLRSILKSSTIAKLSYNPRLYLYREPHSVTKEGGSLLTQNPPVSSGTAASVRIWTCLKLLDEMFDSGMASPSHFVYINVKSTGQKRE